MGYKVDIVAYFHAFTVRERKWRGYSFCVKQKNQKKKKKEKFSYLLFTLDEGKKKVKKAEWITKWN